MCEWGGYDSLSVAFNRNDERNATLSPISSEQFSLMRIGKVIISFY